jgi:hypothetical protein
VPAGQTSNPQAEGVRRITKRAMYTHDNYTFPEQTTAYVVLQHIPGAESVGYILSDTL